MPDSTPTNESGTANLPLDRIIAVIAAAVLLGVFLYFAFRMYDVAGYVPNDPTWLRYMSIYSSISALATTAAGVLLGVQVQRGNVAAANAKADAATDKVQMMRNDVAAVAQTSANLVGGGAAMLPSRDVHSQLIDLLNRY